MTNQHLKSAATNLRQATNDIKNDIQHVQSDANHQKRELEKRIDVIKSEQIALKPGLHSHDKSEVARAHVLGVTRKLDKEKHDLEKTIYDVQDKANKQIDSLNHQLREYDNLASRIDSAA